MKREPVIFCPSAFGIASRVVYPHHCKTIAHIAYQTCRSGCERIFAAKDFKKIKILINQNSRHIQAVILRRREILVKIFKLQQGFLCVLWVYHTGRQIYIHPDKTVQYTASDSVAKYEEIKFGLLRN